MANYQLPRLKIYQSSAGSGKTYTLVREYLVLVLRDPKAYRQVLALTFTNKAAGEMKARIVRALHEVQAKMDEVLIRALEEETGLDAATLSERAGKVLGSVLHDYAHFSVSTIDSFTYRLIRQFARDMELPARFEVEMDRDRLLMLMTDQLMDTIGRDEYVTEILTRFAEKKIEEEKGWDVERDVRQMSTTLFDDDNREQVDKLNSLSGPRFLEFIRHLEEKVRDYPAKMKEFAGRGEMLFQTASVEPSDFKGGKNSFANIFTKLGNAKTPKDFSYAFNKTFVNAVESGEYITKTSKVKDQLEGLLASGLQKTAENLYAYHEEAYSSYLTAWYALKNIHGLGVLKQVEDLLEDHKENNQILHISDFNRKVADFIAEEPPEYIYWRLGERYQHFLLDEFQDTSRKQWENLLPLLEQVLAGSENPATLLLVGDTKQAIYRWRGGDADIMEREAPEFMRVPPLRLATNYRSGEAVIRFNNAFFAGCRDIFSDNPYLTRTYTDFEQETRPEAEGKGFVRLKFLEGASRNDDGPKLRELALEEMREEIGQLLTDGYIYRDLTILVRNGFEGAETARFLSDHGIPVISSDSLFLYKSPSVNFLLSLFQFLVRPYEAIKAAEVVHNYVLYQDPLNKEEAAEKAREVMLAEPPLPALEAALPEEFGLLRKRLDRTPLYELTEELVRIFALNAPPSAYVQHFLDAVLEYSESFEPDLEGFLRYWEDKPERWSLAIPEGENAIRIMTIHKSKGLQFPVVFVPFADWQFTVRSDSFFWAEAKEEFSEYTDSFYLPLQQDLKSTAFSGDFSIQEAKTQLDNLNLLYVAFTRPKDRLYIYTQQQKKKSFDKFTRGGQVIQGALQTQPMQEFWESADEIVYETGFPLPPEDAGEKEEGDFATAMPVNNWRGKLRISRNFERFWEQTVSDEEPEGLPLPSLLAECLRRLQDREKIDLMLGRMQEEGLIGAENRPAIRQKLEACLDRPDIGPWFQPGVRAKLHPELIRPGGGTLKIDRLIRQGKKVIAQSFLADPIREKRVGRELRKFAGQLSEMGYLDVETQLISLFTLPEAPLTE